MILPKTKSHIVRSGFFSLNGPIITRNTFIPVGKVPGGKYHVILIFGTTIDWKKLTLHESDVEYNSACKQYFICGAEDSIIGSLFEVPFSMVDITPNRLSIAKPDTATKFECQTDSGAGGVIVFKDPAENILAIPVNVHPNSFLVSI